MIFLTNSLDEVPIKANYSNLIGTQESRDLLCESMTISDFSRLFHEGKSESSAINEAMSIKYSLIDKECEKLSRAIDKNLRDKGITAGKYNLGKVVKGRFYATVSVQFPVSDGQAINAIFHSPGGDIRKIESQDIITTFKWTLNSKNITDHLIKAKGKDYSISQMGKILAELIKQNHDRFTKNKAKKEEEKVKAEELGLELDQINEANEKLNEDVKELSAKAEFLREENEALEKQVKEIKPSAETEYQSFKQADLEEAAKRYKSEIPAIFLDLEAGKHDRLVINKEEYVKLISDTFDALVEAGKIGEEAGEMIIPHIKRAIDLAEQEHLVKQEANPPINESTTQVDEDFQIEEEYEENTEELESNESIYSAINESTDLNNEGSQIEEYEGEEFDKEDIFEEDFEENSENTDFKETNHSTINESGAKELIEGSVNPAETKADIESEENPLLNLQTEKKEKSESLEDSQKTEGEE